MEVSGARVNCTGSFEKNTRADSFAQLGANPGGGGVGGVGDVFQQEGCGYGSSLFVLPYSKVWGVFQQEGCGYLPFCFTLKQGEGGQVKR